MWEEVTDIISNLQDTQASFRKGILRNESQTVMHHHSKKRKKKKHNDGLLFLLIKNDLWSKRRFFFVEREGTGGD